MAMVFGNKNQGGGPSKKGFRYRVPEKRVINLLPVDENKISPLKAIPAVLLVIALAVAFGKFLVLDRLTTMSALSGKAANMRHTLSGVESELLDYDGIEDVYAHVTSKGMTQEELDRVSRVLVLDLVSTAFPEDVSVGSWSVSGNVMTVDLSGSTLQDLNELARSIEKSPIVDTCMISTAKKDMKNGGTSGMLSSSGSSRNIAEALERRRQEVESGSFGIGAQSQAQGAGVNTGIVQGRLIIHLMQPVEAPEDEAEDAVADNASSASEVSEGITEAQSAPAGKPIRKGADAQ